MPVTQDYKYFIFIRINWDLFLRKYWKFTKPKKTRMTTNSSSFSGLGEMLQNC